jgi:tetratricopeptide (TPR) repeat protein
MDSIEQIGLEFNALLEAEGRGVSTHDLATAVAALVDAVPLMEQLPKAKKAELFYFQGRALSMKGAYDRKAEEALSKSVKLDPMRAEAWIWLGEVFYLKKDYVQAKRCLEGSLSQCGPTKEALRKLSMVVRFLGEPKERSVNVRESVELARRALKLDLNDGYSWYVLGNAQLTQFFVNEPTWEAVNKALVSYTKAQRMSTAVNPDLHYNRAMAYKYLERYQDTYEDLRIAHSIDPSLNADVEADAIVRRVTVIVSKISNKCHIKPKKLVELVRSIPTNFAPEVFGEPVSVAPVNACAIGVNKGRALSCRIMGLVSTSLSEVPTIFVAADCTNEFFAMSVYNLNEESAQHLKVNSEVLIRAPLLQRVTLTTSEHDWSYLCISVSDPNSIRVEGRAITASFTPSIIVNQPV